ncbi:hypothetical protein [Limnohabitans sp. Jir72]|uniref:hypothetical protein n=1 Tax=Limnohabitans sp. Jir72 TaxID=1977909 RepID=UPI001E45FB8B|nr:hypothetical protein [Limnohabitans sp. Jir72]
MRHSTSALLSVAIASLMATTTVHAGTSEQHCPSFLAVDGAPEPSHKGEFTFSPFTHHWAYSAEHKPVVLVALDEQLPGNRFCGLAFFSNSFGQPSTYVYAGQQYNNLMGNPNVFVKVTAGILYGYVGKYQDKVPLNHGGFSPAIIPSIGYRLNEHDSVQVKVLGNAGLMFSYGRSF